MKFVSRAYNTFDLNPITKSSIIKSSNTDRLFGEIIYYKNIPENLKIYFPRLLSCNTNIGNHSLELEYYAYENLGNALINFPNIDLFWEKSFDFIFSYIEQYKKQDAIQYNNSDAYEMFIKKTEVEYNSLFNNFEFFNNLKEEKTFYLNDVPLKCFNTIWNKIRDYIQNNFYSDKFYFIHGDLCFSNILYGHNQLNNDIILKFIDPRGIFGSMKFYGDFYYDLAKISHSVNGGYEFFIYDKFKISTDNTYFYLNFDNKQNEVNELFLDNIKGFNYDLRKIKIIEGLIFIGMCARHYDSLDRQKAMFITGLKILNDIYEEI